MSEKIVQLNEEVIKGQLRALVRGLDRIKLMVGNKCPGTLEAVGEVFPEAKCQRCTVRFYHNVFSVMPRSRVKPAAEMLKTVHVQVAG